MFKKLRITILLYVLLFAAVGNYLDSVRSTDWNDTLWVDVYAINGDGSEAAQAYIERLSDDEFAAIESYFASEARRYGVAISRPFRLELAGQLGERPPELPTAQSALGSIAWSLKMRWYAIKARRATDRPRPDIQLFALYFDPESSGTGERSTALRRGLIAVARVFASRENAGSNRVVMAHELLHTLGSTDKYSLDTNQPLYPHGYAAPEASTLLPQAKAELMAGRIPLSSSSAVIPESLSQTVVGPATATEIRWLTVD